LGRKDKRPRAAATPVDGRNRPRQAEEVRSPQAAQKVPRGGGQADAVETSLFRWRTSDADLEGPWGWNLSSAGQLLGETIPHLHNLETMTWHGLRATGSHPIARDVISRSAQDRLAQIGKAEEETLFSIRITGRRRVWGIRRGTILHLLWWDPEHSVYPVEKHHT